MEQNEPTYPVQLTVDYPDQPLNRLSSFFRLFAAIPILVVISLITGDSDTVDSAIKLGGIAGGLLFLPLLLLSALDKGFYWSNSWRHWKDGKRNQGLSESGSDIKGSSRGG